VVEHRILIPGVEGSIPSTPAKYGSFKQAHGVFMNTPVDYIAGFASAENKLLESMWGNFPWEKRGLTPRREAFFADNPLSYTYGKGVGVRTYTSSPWDATVAALRERLLSETGVSFDVCFANGYADQSDHLGWHADDSAEVDPNRPIAILSFGVAREIWFCEIGKKEVVEKLLLEPGSLCLMRAGMQSTHWHRIPKAGFVCGKRISLTFRGLADV
jgi:alkylated DNA repair dioxygenase AlkB